MKILVSACLLGAPCRYDGKSKPCQAVMALSQRHTLIPVCPEVAGGLPTPRAPSERQPTGGVKNRDGEDVTAFYQAGAEAVLSIAREHGVTHAILKEKSPACGKGRIYDGSFTKILCQGNGVCADLLLQNGILVLGESEIEDGWERQDNEG